MQEREVLIGLTIHLLLPLVGLIAFLILIHRIRSRQIPAPNFFELFLLFVTYGGLLMVAMTSFFWKWSGMASLGIFYLILIAPVAMGAISYRNHKFRGDSIYHLIAFRAGLYYFIIAPMLFAIIAVLTA